MEKKKNNLELRGKGKRSYSCEDYYLDIEGDEDVKDLTREFLRNDGTTSLQNLAQPLESLICNVPIKTFVELIKQANSIDEGIEEADFDGIIAPNYKEEGKKGGRRQLPARFIANADIRKDNNNSYKHDKEGACFGDSQLIINQVNREWQVKDKKLVPYQEIATSLIRQFEEVQLDHIKREGNPIADGLGSLGSTISFRTNEAICSFEIGRFKHPAFEALMDVHHIQEENMSWYLTSKGTSKAENS
ncbi:hypothetical protein EJ110_NYTH47588 [Nymphaea thermarum]|nr:hypothetical protein EJ110_NYTH47588 [Nymphaea thermarum]